MDEVIAIIKNNIPVIRMQIFYLLTWRRKHFYVHWYQYGESEYIFINENYMSFKKRSKYNVEQVKTATCHKSHLASLIAQMAFLPPSTLYFIFLNDFQFHL